MKRLLKKESGFIIALIIIVTILFAIPIFLYTLPTSSNLQWLIREKLKEEDDNIYISGIGIYHSSGSVINSVGNAPKQLSGAELPSYFIINNQAKTLRLIRPIGFPDSRGDRRYIYIEMYLGELLTRIGLLRMISIIVFVVFLLVFIILYNKNIIFRKKMESREQLVRLGEIARTLSHEIKNPLGAIRIQTGYLKRILPKENHDKLKIIEQEVQRLALLTTRIGDFLRDPVGSPEVIDLSSFIDKMIKRFDWDIHFYNRTGGMINIQVDLERLRSVVENLLKNAIESMEMSNEKSPVEVILSCDDKKAELSILDRGCGIPSEWKKRVFDPFFTSKTKGSGIGLFMSRRFIEAMGGYLSLLPRRDGGTEARISFIKSKEK